MLQKGDQIKVSRLLAEYVADLNKFKADIKEIVEAALSTTEAELNLKERYEPAIHYVEVEKVAVGYIVKIQPYAGADILWFNINNDGPGLGVPARLSPTPPTISGKNAIGLPNPDEKHVSETATL